jgi:hypothetical protein
MFMKLVDQADCWGEKKVFTQALVSSECKSSHVTDKLFFIKAVSFEHYKSLRRIISSNCRVYGKPK